MMEWNQGWVSDYVATDKKNNNFVYIKLLKQSLQSVLTDKAKDQDTQEAVWQKEIRTRKLEKHVNKNK